MLLSAVMSLCNWVREGEEGEGGEENGRAREALRSRCDRRALVCSTFTSDAAPF